MRKDPYGEKSLTELEIVLIFPLAPWHRFDTSAVKCLWVAKGLASAELLDVVCTNEGVFFRIENNNCCDALIPSAKQPNLSDSGSWQERQGQKQEESFHSVLIALMARV